MITIAASVAALIIGSFNITIATATAFTEVSTILLHVRYYMIKAKKADGTPFLIIMILFIGLFIYARLYLQSFVAKRMYEGFNASYNELLTRDPLIMKL